MNKKKVPTDDTRFEGFATGLLRDHLNMMITDKTEMVAKEGRSDISMSMIYLARGHGTLIFIMIAVPTTDVPAPAQVGAAMAAARETNGPPRLVVFGADAAMKVFDKDDRNDMYRGMQTRRGDLIRSIGKDPRVRECLTCSVYYLIGGELRSSSKVVPYDYVADKEVAFDWVASEELGREKAATGGAIDEVVRAAFAEGMS